MVFCVWKKNEINTGKIPAQTQRKDTRTLCQLPRKLLESVNLYNKKTLRTHRQYNRKPVKYFMQSYILCAC